MQIIQLADFESISSCKIGGKARNLAKMASAGIPIPDGWVVPADAFYAHLALHNLSDLALAAAQNPQEHLCRQLREAIVSADMEKDLVKSLSCLPEVPMAVRSSASIEDSTVGSYSGLFKTILGVDIPDKLMKAAKDVWASVFTPEALAYHQRVNGTADYPAMAVLIMPIIDAEAAGVAFSANPADGNPFQIVVSACRGLGTTVVKGHESCDHCLLDLDSLEIIESRVGTQEYGEFAQGSCLPEIKPIPRELQGVPVLNDENLRQIGKLVRLVDELFSERVDVEFAVSERKVIILQARRIIGLPSYFPDNPEELKPDVHRSQDQWTGPLSPFARATLVDSSDLKPMFPRPPWPLEVDEFILHHGRLFHREPKQPEYEEDPHRPWEDRTFVRRMLALDDPNDDFHEWMTWTSNIYASVIPLLRNRAERLLRFATGELHSLDRSSLGDLLSEAITIEQEAGSLYVSSSGSTYESLRRIEILARDWITSGDHREASQLALALIQGAPKLTHVRDSEVEAVAEGVEKIENVVCRWGYSFLNIEDMMDISRWKSWREDPIPLQTAIELMQKQSEGSSIMERIQECVERSEEELQKAMAAVQASDPQEGRKRAITLAACVRAARCHFPLKDDRDLVLSHAQAALRWILIEASRRLLKDGAILEEDDIFLLQPAEIVECSSNAGCAASNILRLVEQRRNEQLRLARYTLPALTMHRGSTTEGGQVLQGGAASAGVAEGTARVVQSVTDVGELQPGEILCLKGERRIGWTIFFPIIGGLVYERGNWLCHESNLCRELGIPAVVSLDEKIHAIKTGENLRIDGGKGIVYRLDFTNGR